jgi:hypothetical protein
VRGQGIGIKRAFPFAIKPAGGGNMMLHESSYLSSHKTKYGESNPAAQTRVCENGRRCLDFEGARLISAKSLALGNVSRSMCGIFT